MVRSIDRIAKKKIDDDLELYFPNLFANSKTKEYYDILKHKVMLQIDQIKNGKDNTDKILSLEDKILGMFPPKKFGNTDNNEEIRYEKDHEDMCIALSNNLNLDVKNSTVFEFYSSFEYLKAMIAKKEMNQRKNKKNGR